MSADYGSAQYSAMTTAIKITPKIHVVGLRVRMVLIIVYVMRRWYVYLKSRNPLREDDDTFGVEFLSRDPIARASNEIEACF